MAGRFNVFEEDRHPFLHEEARWISQCMARSIPLLGICQGAQQIARVLGAAVGPKPGEPTEFGYYEITPSAEGREIFPEQLVVSQSHFHTFDIPAGATQLAGSALFPNQAFRHGETSYALQFHAEVTPEGFRRWQNAPWARYGKPGAQSREEQDRLMAAHDDGTASLVHGISGAAVRGEVGDVDRGPPHPLAHRAGRVILPRWGDLERRAFP